MRYAVFANTSNGCELAGQVQAVLGSSVDVFVHKGKLNDKSHPNFYEYDHLSELVPIAFQQYDGLIFIMSAGITVRMIAPYIVNKLKDPAVLVMDEKGSHIISLLSGHVGGANVLTRLLAKELNADPVITTATDVNNILAPDSLAVELGLMPWPKEGIETINSGLLDGKDVVYMLDEEMKRSKYYGQRLKEEGINFQMLSEGLPDENYLKVVVTDQFLPIQSNILYLRPRKLIAGVGCRRDTAALEIQNALAMACRIIGKPVANIDAIASTVVKANEAGLLKTAENLSIPIYFYDNDALQAKIDSYGLKESDFVKETIGVGSVAEAAALCCVEHGQIILTKMKFGKVTVALVWEK